MNEIKMLQEKLYRLSFDKTLILLGTNKLILWPIPYGFDRAYQELQIYFEGTNKSLHALKKLGSTEECYFIIRKKEKIKKMC